MRGAVWKVVLGVSLTLNLFVIGAIAGVLVLRHQVQAHRGEDPVLAAADRLPPARRDAFRAAIAQKLTVIRPTLRDARLARHDAMLRIAAQPFDRTAASMDLARGRADDAAARGALEETILDFAQTLPLDQRAVLVKGLQHAALVRWMSEHPGARRGR